MRYFLTFIWGALICCCSSMFAQTRLQGDIKNIGNSSLIIKYVSRGLVKDTTLKITNGKFDWLAPITETQKITMIFPGRAIYIFVEPANMTIKGNRDSVDYLRVTGSKTNDEAVTYAKSIKPLLDQNNALSAQYGKLSKELEAEREAKQNANAAERLNFAINYIKAHPQSAFSLNLVTEYSRLGSYEKVWEMFEPLSSTMKLTTEGKAIAERLVLLKHSSIGEKIKDFALNDSTGKPKSFSDFKGKYVLIDFWASWCYPCREEIPNLIKNYSLYKDGKFTIVSVSLDDQADRWKKAMDVHQMPWTQLLASDAWDSEIVKYFGIQGIPSTILVDPNGIIIAKDLRGISLTQKLKEILGSSTL